MDINKIIHEAIQVVNMFDQANTSNAIRSIGSRGELLESAINELRSLLNEDKQVTILTEEQAR